MQNNQSASLKKDLLIVLGIWIVSSISDRIWISLDRNPPSWDLAKHLNGSLNYWSFFQNTPQLLSGEWWKSLWMLSEKYPPVVYLLTAPFLNWFGIDPDVALLVNLLFSAILIVSVYGIGKNLFGSQVGLFSAVICVLLPRLYIVRLQYLVDYPLTALVIAAFCCLTIWKGLVNTDEKASDRSTLAKNWYWIIGFGFCFGLAMLIKQTTLFFLFFPLLWLGFKYLFSKAWLRLFQLSLGILLGILICGGWYRTNWVFVLSAFGNANVTPARLEGDPPLNTLAAWTHYWNDLPSAVSWVLLLVPIVGLLLATPRLSREVRINRIRLRNVKPNQSLTNQQSTINNQQSTELTLITPTYLSNCISLNKNLIWLGGYFLAAYLINSAFVNKDHRYIMPYLPVVAVFLAYGLTQWRYPWGKWVRWGTISLSILLMWMNLFPLSGTWLTQSFTPNSQYYAYLGKPWHHQELIQEIIDTEPYLTANLGVLPSTPEINQHNFNYYGVQKNFQVYGRQVGVRIKEVDKDARSMSWFITKTGDRQGLSEAQSAILKLVETGSDFLLQKDWNLPDNTLLKLYHRRQPFVEVQPVNGELSRVKLDKVTLPPQTPPGKLVPVTYEWSGSWQELQSGLVLLTWKRDTEIERRGDRKTKNNEQTTDSIVNINRWLHDRAIGMGNLHSPIGIKPQDGFRVVEHLAMFPPEDLVPGNYTLEGTYLNRVTGESYPISVPVAKLEIAPQSTPTPSPELDLVTQMRLLSQGLPKGREALDPIFSEIGRINQYDPTQDYLAQAEKTLSYRLQQEPTNLEFMYALALSQALQQKINPLIETLKQVVQLDANNPYAHAYLAFIYIYDWHPHQAEMALQPAMNLNPNLVEIKALRGIAAIMQGNLIKGWQIYQDIKPLLSGKANK
ncbi:glycosyltransferase family 39 protein [Merismopedia glauca]|uniref:Phospholipid carrier-dependent glycosyltransferase n=1 Tax=Merismopedia glauca CCAP 1448/3 TaxID=1296344 RepID=A0A2T1BZQ4_9CYAN|nr:glycosyltransferase family 39 protein [Merismopedia glauca]PSB01434.1 phospholipid carrier-dependent glycosyltransferase [Merismopedia glauca CCAP 1448/3]